MRCGGELLAREGRYAEAVDAARAALDGELTEPERRYQQRRLDAWTVELPGHAAGWC
jgi:hypothetical protein